MPLTAKGLRGEELGSNGASEDPWGRISGRRLHRHEGAAAVETASINYQFAFAECSWILD
jgi:hypothetical protein